MFAMPNGSPRLVSWQTALFYIANHSVFVRVGQRSHRDVLCVPGVTTSY